jgi:ATP-dependent Clp protease ATP-binding subunit ClpC
VLGRLGLNLENIRAEVEKQTGTGPDQKKIGIIPFTPRVKRVLDLARREAKNLNHTYIGTEHLLLALAREGDGIAAQVLRNLGADLERGYGLKRLKNWIPILFRARMFPRTGLTLQRKIWRK